MCFLITENCNAQEIIVVLRGIKHFKTDKLHLQTSGHASYLEKKGDLAPQSRLKRPHTCYAMLNRRLFASVTC